MERILHISFFTELKPKGCAVNSMQTKISNGLIRNGYSVFNFSDRDMHRALSLFGHKDAIGKRRTNRALLEYAAQMKPDGIVIGHADTIETETLLELKTRLPGLRILEWNFDGIGAGGNPHFQADCDFNVQKILKKFPAVDAMLVTTAEKKYFEPFMGQGKKVGFLPNAVDTSLETAQAFEHADLTYDFIFPCRPKMPRQFAGQTMLVDDIVAGFAKIPGLKCLFPGFSSPLLQAAAYQDGLAQTAMGLNLSHTNDVYLYSSDRIAHFMGNGLLTFIDQRTGYNDLLSDKEAVFYTEAAEVFDKLAFYKKNIKERQKIAKNGYEKYRKVFNETVIGKYIGDVLFDRFNPREFDFPTLIGV